HGRAHDQRRREHGRPRPDAPENRRLLRRRGRHRGDRTHLAARADHDRVPGRRRRWPRRGDVPADLQAGYVDEVVKALNVNTLLRGFAWARLGLAVVLLSLGPVMPSVLVVSGEHPVVLALALLIAAISSGVLLLFGPGVQPRPVAWLFGLLDIVLITAIVAATGGGRSIFSFLYVLSVTGACVLLSRTGGLAMAGVASVLYTGVVLARTVFPTNVFFDATEETTALELLSMFLNAGTFLTVAIVAGSLAEQFRATSQELETQRKDLADLQAFKDLVFQSVGTGLIALD